MVDGVNLTELSQTAIKLNGADQTINSDVSFEHVTVNGNLSLHDHINGKNISNVFADTLMKSGDQTITAHHKITNLIGMQHVAVDGTINGRNLSEEVVPLK